jgi:hypothetical protein
VTDPPEEDGYGCFPTAQAFGLLAAFVIIAATIGVSLALRAGCDGICEQAGFTLYAAALPISALFAFFAGELPVAWPLDATFWIIVSFGLGRIAERRPMTVAAVVVRAMIVALAFGFVIAMFLESVDA